MAQPKYIAQHRPSLTLRATRDFGLFEPQMRGYAAIIDTIFQAGIVEFRRPESNMYASKYLYY